MLLSTVVPAGASSLAAKLPCPCHQKEAVCPCSGWSALSLASLQPRVSVSFYFACASAAPSNLCSFSHVLHTERWSLPWHSPGFSLPAQEAGFCCLLREDFNGLATAPRQKLLFLFQISVEINPWSVSLLRTLWLNSGFFACLQYVKFSR